MGDNGTAQSNGRLTRRRLISHAAMLAGATVLTAACAPAPTASPTSAPAPTTAAQATKPAAAATTAPSTAASPAATAAAKPTTAAGAAQPTTAAKAATSSGPAEISWTFWDNPKNVGYDLIIENWTKANPNIKINPMATPDRYEDKVRTMLSAGTPPEIIQINDDYNVTYAKKGWTRAMDDYVKTAGWKKEDFYPVIWDFAWGSGHFSYVTIGNRGRAIIYNKDMLDKTGLKALPTTWDPSKWESQGWWNWDKAVEYGTALTKREGNRTSVWGISLWTEGRSESYWAMATGLEGAPYSKDGKKFTLADPDGIKTVQYLADLNCKHKIAPDPASLQQLGYVDMFRSGQLAMFYGSTSHAGDYRKTIKDFKWDVSPIPVGPSGKNPNGNSLVGMSIPVKTKFPDQAWQFLEYIMGDDSQKILASNAFIPARPSQAKLFEVPGQAPEHNNVFIEAMGFGQMENFTENTERARQIYAPEMDAIANCSSTAQEVLTRVRPDVEAALEGKL